VTKKCENKGPIIEVAGKQVDSSCPLLLTDSIRGYLLILTDSTRGYLLKVVIHSQL